MSTNLKIAILMMLLIMFWILPLHAAESRGVKIVIRDRAGQEVGLYENSYALVIGVSNYTNGWPDLPGVQNEVVPIRTALEKHGFDVTVVENPDSDALQKAYKDFINKHGRNPDDRLLLYFSGHGHTLKKGYGGDMGYIVPADTPNPNKDLKGFQAKAMSMQMIEVYARDIDSKHALFLFDSCFSGSLFAITKSVPENISYKTAKPVRQFITAGTADEQVPDPSIFCQQFVAALNGEADTDDDSYMTGMELGEFLQKQVINYSRGSQHPQCGKIRDTNLDKGDFVFMLPEPEPPPPDDFSIEDMKIWASRLVEMKEAFSQIKDLEGIDLSSDAKATAWEHFLKSFKKDNPFSEEDDSMREEASKQLSYWQNAVNPEKTKPPTAVGARTKISPIDGAEMVLIPAGEFQMGSNDHNSEKPIHTVYVDAFYIGKYEVTNAQYRKFMYATGHKAPKYWSDSEYNAPDQPVVGVSWHDAAAYAKWAGKRLPTEAEWEKAARGGLKGKKYPWGDSLSHDDANYDGTAGKDRWEKTSPVGRFAPNGYGLYDMAGNVAEWCADWYGKNYYSSSPERNPTGPSSGKYRVLRGGSWYYLSTGYLRCTYRYSNRPTNTGNKSGFRCSE